MLKHIVMWRLHDQAQDRTKAANAQIIKTELEALAGRIPGLLHIEVGVDALQADGCADVVLISHFTDRQALADYQAHPLHQAVLPTIRALSSARQVVDYEQ